MSNQLLALCVATVLAASGARADLRPALIRDGEPESILEGARWTLMGPVNIVIFSPKGDVLASGGSDGVVRLWEVSTGRLKRTLEGHSSDVVSLAFDPQGLTLASGSKDTHICLWEVSTGRLKRTLEGHSDLVRSLAFSPTGELVASAGGDNKVRLWQARTGKDLGARDAPRDSVIAFDSAGKLLTAGGTHEVYVYDSAGRLLTADSTQEELVQWEVDAQKGLTPPAAFAKAPPSQSADTHAATTTPMPAPLVEEGTGRALQQVKGLSDPFLVFSPDKRLLASGGKDNSVWLRHTPSGPVLRELKGHTAPVQTMAFSPDGRLLASGSSDSTVRLWDIATGLELRRLTGNLTSVWSVAFGRDGSLSSAGSDSLIHKWEPAAGLEQMRLESQATLLRAVAASADGRLLAAGGEDGLVYLWEQDTGPTPRRFKGHTGPIYSVAFSSDGRLLASGSADGTARVWDTDSGNSAIITGVGPKPGGSSAPRGGSAQKRKPGATPPVEARSPQGIVSRAVAFSPDNKLLVIGWDSGSIQSLPVESLRDVQPQERLPTDVVTQEGPVRALAFSPDGQVLASAGGEDGKVQLWDMKARRPLRALKGHASAVWALAFSPDGDTLASGGGDKKILLWKPGTGQLLRTLEGHASWITSLAFDPRGASLASADDSGIIRLWAPQESEPFRGLLRSAWQGWLSQLPDHRIRRHDDGSFLSRPREDGSLEPIPPRQPELPPQLSAVSQELRTAPGDFGEPGELLLTVANAQEAGRAYWVRVEPMELPPGLILVPPDAVPRVDAGGSADIRLRLSYLRPERAPVPAEPKLRLKLVDAFGREFPLEALSLPLRTPQLVLMGEPQLEGKSVSVTLRNEGTQATGGFTAQAWLQDSEDVRVYPSEGLRPGTERTISIPVPAAALDAREFPLHFTVDYASWPRRWEAPTTLIHVPWPYATLGLLVLGAALLFGFVYYASVYLNPMVVRADKSPAALRNYPLAHMLAADHALRRARKRDSAITAAGIPVTRWERALCGAREPQAAATAFAEAIGGRLGTSLASQAWTLSLPPLRLRFARDTAVVVFDGTGLESGEAERRMADVFQDGRGPGQVLVLDRTNAQNARKVLEGVPRVRCVVLSSNQLRDLLLDEEPVRVLEGIISEQVAVSELSPYQVAGGVKLENLFFGREREVRAIADRSVRNFLVVGQRQMGKSSLLLAVLRRLQARSDLDAQYVELADGDLPRRLARERERMPAGGGPLPPFEEIAAGAPSRPRVWLIDEADDFISADAKAGYPVLQAMRALAEEGRAYFILAGFWDLYRAVVLDEKQPLRNFGEHLRLEPLDARSALALVTEPMVALGLQWDAPSTPEFLVEQAGRRANLLVLACKALVESLPPDTHTLTREHLERVFREDKDLRDQGRRWRGDHPLHRAVVRQALLLGRPTREEVRQALKARGTDIRSVDFDEAMDHRELSYVLVPDGDGRLYCPVPLMQRYIEAERGLEVGLTEDLEDLRRRGLAEVPKPV